MTIDIQPPQKPSGTDNASTIDRLAAKVLKRLETHPPTKRVLIAISGVPGSGKTTLATAVAARVQAAHHQDNVVSIVPMDGYHLYRSQLAAMANAAEAIHRRGAAFTFDAQRFHQLVQALRAPVTDGTSTIYAPSFDHGLKDPVEDDIAIPPEARIVILEGLYLSLDREPWSSAARLMDELWFLDVDREVAIARLVRRHVQSRIVSGVAAAEHRVASTDLLNADDILNNRLPVHEHILL